MKQLFKQLFILTPILVCIGFLASIGHVVRSERENSLHRQFQVTVEDVDQIDRIITFASTRRKKCDMEFMRWIDNTIGAATSEEVVATILSSELQPLNKRVRHNRNVANHLVKDTAIIELLNGSESGGILINNKSVSPYDAMIYFK
jgi:hypothetical protein